MLSSILSMACEPACGNLQILDEVTTHAVPVVLAWWCLQDCRRMVRGQNDVVRCLTRQNPAAAAGNSTPLMPEHTGAPKASKGNQGAMHSAAFPKVAKRSTEHVKYAHDASLTIDLT